MGGGMGGPGGPHRRPEETAAEEGSGDGGHSGPSRPTININFKKHGKRFWITWAIVAVVVIGFCYWWFHPSLNIHSADLWWFVGIFLCVPAFLIFRSLYNSKQINRLTTSSILMRSSPTSRCCVSRSQDLTSSRSSRRH